MENLFLFFEQQYVLIIALGGFIFLFMRHESIRGGIKLSCQEVVNAVNAGNAILLDVRDAKEFKAGHIVDAIHIPYAKVADNLHQLEKHREKRVIVVDKLGQQSASVVKTLKANEFEAARMNGGIAEWQHDNLPLVKSKK